MSIKYKYTEDGKSIMADDKGMPIIVDEKENKEFGLDAIHLYLKIPALQEESKNHRLKAKELEDKLTLFGGIDPVLAKDALSTVSALSAGDLKKKEEVDRLKKETEEAWAKKMSEIIIAHEAALKGKDDTLLKKDDDLRKVMISSNFATSNFFSGKTPVTTLLPDIAEAYFGKHFRIDKSEDGGMVVVGQVKGQDIYSKNRPGEFANFDEAMERIIEVFPNRDKILQKSTGSGAPGSNLIRGRVLPTGDQKAFLDNLEAIATGDVTVT